MASRADSSFPSKTPINTSPLFLLPLYYSSQHLSSPAQSRLVQELANPTGDQSAAVVHESPESDSDRNKWSVLKLYEALNYRDVDAVHRLLNPDLEWWFHGPPVHQHMMRVLTGATPEDSFVFTPVHIEAFGPTVLVEGSNPDSSVYWVHAWTVGSDGIITQVREYFNTDLIVTKLGDSVNQVQEGKSKHCSSPVWRSWIIDPTSKSLPGLCVCCLLVIISGGLD
ncbi:hypothetical protein LUZ60_013107 [Juncus effusus]|nr:hypothetical protein LUZ60_013107 [Juncus effusus]